MPIRVTFKVRVRIRVKFRVGVRIRVRGKPVGGVNATRVNPGPFKTIPLDTSHPGPTQ